MSENTEARDIIDTALDSANLQKDDPDQMTFESLREVPLSKFDQETGEVPGAGRHRWLTLTPQNVLVVEDETDFDDIVGRLDSLISLRDGDHKTWLAWCSADGEWYGIRPLDEDDTAAQATDPTRPIGPSSLEDLPRPWVIATPAVPYPTRPTEKKD